MRIVTVDYIEEWKPVIGFECYYEVSNLGQIRSIADGQGRRTNRLLSCWLSTFGYPQVQLQIKNRSKSFLVHRLVAEAFLGQRPEGKEVDHKDGNKANNTVPNLRYVTRSENVLARNDRRRSAGLPLTGLQHGEYNPQAKLTNEKVTEIRRLGMEGMPRREIAEHFGVNRSCIGKILRGERWKNNQLDV